MSNKTTTNLKEKIDNLLAERAVVNELLGMPIGYHSAYKENLIKRLAKGVDIERLDVPVGWEAMLMPWMNSSYPLRLAIPSGR